MAQVVTCPPAGCKSINTSACIFYEGPVLMTTGINTNDSVEVAIQKIDEYLSYWQGVGPGDNENIIKKDVFQIAHGFVVGNAIRHDGIKWVKAQANILANSGTVGVVSAVFDTNNFTYQWGGYIASGSWDLGVSYFLSTTVAGDIVLEEQYGSGQVREFIGTGTEHGLLLELDLGDLYESGVEPGPGGAINTVTSYRSSFEITDGKVYAGYLLNEGIVITRTIDGILENAQNLTNLEADWINRLNLTYV